MLNRVSAYIRTHQLLSPEGLHLVALSGGADSVALLMVLLQLGYRVEAMHCNFRLRGAESDRDESFVSDLCQRLDVPLHLAHFDTREYAALRHVSIEMAARDLRYSYFRQLRQDLGAETICVAHHRDDSVETLLMNLLRGSGIHGLTGIRPKNGEVVRPLLCVSRQEIEHYLHSIGQDYVVDSTNLETDIVRNKIRLKVIPMLQEINPSVAENISKTASYLADAEQILNVSVRTSLSQLVMVDGLLQSVSIPSLLSHPSPRLLLHEWLSPYGFNASQITQMSTSLRGESGREFHTPGHTLFIDRETLLLAPHEEPMKSMKIPEEGCYVYHDKTRFDFTLSEDVSISKSADCATLDAATVEFPLTVRPVQSGDTFCPFGMKGRKLVSDFLTDRKLSLYEKRRQLVVTDASDRILWIVGQRTDHRFRLTPHTLRILRIKHIAV